MATNKYRKFGLRRDRNLSDLSNSTEGLNNLLDGLVDNTAVDSFISEDLDAIRGIYSYGLVDEDYRQVIESEEKITNNNGIDISFFPRITYKNRLDKLKLFSGEPRYRGGNGLTAKYYNKSNIYADTSGIFSGTPYYVDNFWERGEFEFDNNVSQLSGNADDGIEWEGYFVPIESGEHTFTITSTACGTVDFQTEGYTSGIGTYSESLRIGITTSLLASGTEATDTISLETISDTKFIGIGQSVSGTGISTGSIIQNYNRITGIITLQPPENVDNAVYSSFNGSVTFFKTIGQETRSFVRTYILNKYTPYRIRIRYFIPKEIDAGAEKKIFNIDVSNPLEIIRDFWYYFLYSLEYDFSSSAKGEFENFLDNSISLGGGTIGSQTSSSGYVKVKTNNKIDIKYEPKKLISEITKSSITASTTSGSNILKLNDTSNIEIGNYIFGNGVPEDAQVTDIGINYFVSMNKNATQTSSGVYTFIEHRGFVKRGFGSSQGSTFNTTSEVKGLKDGMIMIGSGVEQYTGITTTSVPTSLIISPPQTIGSGTTVYFYQSRGLINDSLISYCTPTTTKCLILSSSVPSGSTVIPVTNTTGISNNWKVQGIQFQDGTVINSFTTNSITINKSTIENLNAGGNFTVTNSNDNKTICCPPTDTSPPFNPTTLGLDTVPTAPNLRLESGNIIFDSISAGISTLNITSYLDTDFSGSRLTIQTPLTTVGTAQTNIFKILCG